MSFVMSNINSSNLAIKYGITIKNAMNFHWHKLNIDDLQ